MLIEAVWLYRVVSAHPCFPLNLISQIQYFSDAQHLLLHLHQLPTIGLSTSTSNESKRCEYRLEFGKFQGQKLVVMPPAYVAWLVKENAGAKHPLRWQLFLNTGLPPPHRLVHHRHLNTPRLSVHSKRTRGGGERRGFRPHLRKAQGQEAFRGSDFVSYVAGFQCCMRNSLMRESSSIN